MSSLHVVARLRGTLGLLLIVIFSQPLVVQAASTTGVAYTNDPGTFHAGFWGPGVVVTFDGRADEWITIRRNGSLQSSAQAIPSRQNPNQAQMNGWIPVFTGAADGDSISVTPGGASCRVVRRGGYIYCGVPIPASEPPPAPPAPTATPDPDFDDDGVPDNADTCRELAGPPSNEGCPLPVSGDEDGDSVSDDRDRCPSEAGATSNSGCPVPAPAPPGTVIETAPVVVVDSDGDGVVDGQDVCPGVLGIASQSGCPFYPDPNASCNTVVNHNPTGGIRVRQQPTTSSEIVTTIGFATPPMSVGEITPGGDGLQWLEVTVAGQTGWVREDLVMDPLGIDCDTLGIAPPPSRLDSLIYDACPDLLLDLSLLSDDTKQHLATTDDPCQNVANALGQIAGTSNMIDFNAPRIVSECPAAFATYTNTLDTLARHDAARAREYALDVNERGCAAIRPAGMRTDSVEVVVSCILGIESTRLEEVLRVATQLDIDLTQLTASDPDCLLVLNISIVGGLDADELALFERIQQVCNRHPLAAYDDLRRLLEAGQSVTVWLGYSEGTLCEGWTGAPLPPQDAPLLERCAAELVNLWKRRIAHPQSTLSDETIARIENAPNPCAAIRDYLKRGRLPRELVLPPLNPPPIPGSTPLHIRVELIPSPLNLQPMDNASSTQATIVTTPLPDWRDELGEGYGYFVGNAPDSQSLDLYVVGATGYRSVTTNSPSDEFSPARTPEGHFAYLVRDPNSGETALLYRRPLRGLFGNEADPQTGQLGEGWFKLNPPARMQFDTTARLVWDPVLASHLWATLVDADGDPLLVRLNLGTESLLELEATLDPASTPNSMLVVPVQLPGARDAIALGTDFIVYEYSASPPARLSRVDLQNEPLESAIDGQPDVPVPCRAAAAWSLQAGAPEHSLLYVCGEYLYRSGVYDTAAAQEIGWIGAVSNLARVPTDETRQFMSYDDGDQVYVSYEFDNPRSFTTLTRAQQLSWYAP